MMQITDAAKKILGEALAEQQCNALRLAHAEFLLWKVFAV